MDITTNEITKCGTCVPDYLWMVWTPFIQTLLMIWTVCQMYACMCHSPAVSGCCIDCSLLTANYIIIDVSSGEGHPSHSHRLRLVINKLHALLQQTHMDWASRLWYRCDGCWCSVSTDLRLWHHIQAPGAHPAVCGHSDQVVGILSADHIDTVDRVLWEKYIYITPICHLQLSDKCEKFRKVFIQWPANI